MRTIRDKIRPHFRRNGPGVHGAGRTLKGLIKLNETTKYGLFFVGGVLVGALGAVALTRGKLDVKPLATDLLSSGIDLKDKLMAGVDGVREDLADVMAEAEVKAQERRAAKEAEAAAAEAEVVAEAEPKPAV